MIIEWGEVVSQKYVPIYPENTHLAPSKETEGRVRGCLLDNETNQVAGQAEWELVEDESDNDLAEVLAAIAVGSVLVFELVKEVVWPRAMAWWGNNGFPAVSRTWNKIVRKRENVANDEVVLDTLDMSTQDTNVLRISPRDIDSAIDYYSNNKDSEQAQKSLVNIVVLATLLAKEIRGLPDERMGENGELIEQLSEWESAFETLSTKEVTESVNSILEANASLLDRDSLNAFSNTLGVCLFRKGKFVPIENGKVKEALSLERCA